MSCAPRMRARDSWPLMSNSTAALGPVGAGEAQALRFYVSGEHHPENGTLLGFWLYLMSDSLVFASLFATYGVLGRNYAGGPSGTELFELPLVAINTSLLLLSSITYGFVVIAMRRNRRGATLAWLAVTGLLGASFVGIALHEFAHLIEEGNGPQRSAFLSSFFTLVGTHGLHVAIGLFWMLVLWVETLARGLASSTIRKLTMLSLFWHFLDIVWIFIFTDRKSVV